MATKIQAEKNIFSTRACWGYHIQELEWGNNFTFEATRYNFYSEFSWYIQWLLGQNIGTIFLFRTQLYITDLIAVHYTPARPVIIMLQGCIFQNILGKPQNTMFPISDRFSLFFGDPSQHWATLIWMNKIIGYLWNKNFSPEWNYGHYSNSNLKSPW
jgi:hypothetical protein